jgi:hypothetical protein
MHPERTGHWRCWNVGWDGREFWTSQPTYVELHGDARRTVMIQGVLRYDGAPLSAAKVLASPALDREPEQVTGKRNDRRDLRPVGEAGVAGQRAIANLRQAAPLPKVCDPRGRCAGPRATSRHYLPAGIPDASTPCVFDFEFCLTMSASP